MLVHARAADRMADLRPQINSDLCRIRKLEDSIAILSRELDETRERLAENTKKMHILLDELVPLKR
jgi:hypothetical protein